MLEKDLLKINESSKQALFPTKNTAELPSPIVRTRYLGEEIAREIPPPPPWLGRAAYWFRLGFAVVILISSLLSLTSCGVSAEEAQWQPASKYFERSLLDQIVTENSSLKPSEEVISKIQARQLAKRPRLIVVNFDNGDLCGQLGCLYTIYIEKQGKAAKVFSRYLTLELPKGVQLFEISNRTQNDLPCVVVNQVAGSNLNKLSFCYDGSQYQNNDLNVVKIKSTNKP